MRLSEMRPGQAPGLVHEGLERAARRFGGKAALLAGERSLTFGELEELANSFAAHLVARGVGRGDRVVVMLPNRPEFLVAVEGILKVGAAAVLLNPSWKALEVRHALELTSPCHGVCDATNAGMLRDVLGEDRLSDADAVDHSGSSSDIEGPSDPGSEALLVFSSGTTGLPKAVRHTHRSIGHAIAHWGAALGLGPEDRFQVATPPSHILGLLNLVTAIDAGATVRMHVRFDLDEVLQRIAGERMSLEMAVAPIALAMANHPNLEKYDLSSLRYIMWGATPVTPSVAEEVTRRTGVRWLPAYGATELPVLAANRVDDPGSWRLDTAGVPPSEVELRVVDLDNGEVVPAGKTGEIQARSPSLMAGYIPEEANVEAFDGGWYRTGDVGWLEPEGWVHITDRSKEMIKVNGFQVAPAELEGVLLGHPGVVDCAVFGVPDEGAGEVPVAAVQLEPSYRVTQDELLQLVARSLSSYKRLRHVVVVESIPRLPSGKVLRRQLREGWKLTSTESGGG